MTFAFPANARTWTGACDRSGWLPGPWDAEPDKVSWTDPATGRPCLIVRNHSGALCGYVAVDPGDPRHGTDYDEVPVEVHGGLTYSDRCMETADEGRGICHVPEPGAPEDVWWFGFDCAHWRDVVPRYQASNVQIGVPSDGEQYRDLAYVVGEVESLARQLVGGAR